MCLFVGISDAFCCGVYVVYADQDQQQNRRKKQPADRPYSKIQHAAMNKYLVPSYSSNPSPASIMEVPKLYLPHVNPN